MHVLYSCHDELYKAIGALYTGVYGTVMEELARVVLGAVPQV